MADYDWLKDLKPGDRMVARNFDCRVENYATLTVVKVTSQFVTATDDTGGELKFRRKDRWQVGVKENYEYKYWRLHATEAAHADAEERSTLLDRLYDCRVGFRLMDDLTTDQLRRIAAILDEGKKNDV